MVAEIILVVVILILVAFIWVKDKEHNKQQNRLINAVIAKTPQELAHLTLSEKTKIDLENKPPLGPIPAEFTEIGSADDETFDKMIDRINNPQNHVDEEIEGEKGG